MKEKANTAVDMTFKIVPKDALDTLWFNSSINIQTISQAELDEYFSETRMFPDPVYGKPRAILTGDSTCFVHACYIDYGGEEIAWHKNGRKTNTAYQMRDAFGEPGQFNNATCYTIEVKDAGMYQIDHLYLSAGKHKLKFTMVDAESAVVGLRFTKVD